MTQTAKNNSILKAKSELKALLTRADSIIQRFTDSYGGYTARTGGKKVAVFFLSILLLGLLIASPTIISFAYELAGGALSSTASTLVTVAVYSISLYIALFTLKIIVRLIRIGKINGYIARINQIKRSLNDSLGAVEKNMSTLEKEIKNKNVKITPKTNFDSRLNIYESYAKTYSCPDGKGLKALVNILYWVSTLLFGASFILVTASSIAQGICESFNINIYGLIIGIYAAIAVGAIILLHSIVSNRKSEFGFGAYVLSLLCGPLSAPAIFIACGLIYLVIKLFVVFLVICLIIGIISAIFGG